MAIREKKQIKAKRRLVREKSFYDRYKNIEKVNSAEGGFYNPTTGNFGKFYMDYMGIPSSTIIKYVGNINIRINEALNEKILIKNIKEVGTIIILNINAARFDDTLLFEYSGNIKRITSAIVSGFQTKEFVPSIVEYDLENIPANKSKTKPEDDSIILREDVEEAAELPTLNNSSNFDKLKISSNLPSNYVNDINLLINDDMLEIDENKKCSTCSYFQYNYCNLWKGSVRARGWCESWKSKYEQFEVQEEINEL